MVYCIYLVDKSNQLAQQISVFLRTIFMRWFICSTLFLELAWCWTDIFKEMLSGEMDDVRPASDMYQTMQLEIFLQLA